MPVTKLNRRTIRARLRMSLILMTILPAFGIAIVSITVGYFNARQQAIQGLESAGALKELALQGWIASTHQELLTASDTSSSLEHLGVVLGLARDGKQYDFYNRAVRNRLQARIDQSKLIDEFYLVDEQGMVILSTDMAQEGGSYKYRQVSEQDLENPFTQLPFRMSKTASESSTLVRAPGVFGVPITIRGPLPGGILIAHSSPDILYDILREGTGLGRTGTAYLINPEHLTLFAPGISSAEMVTPDEKPSRINGLGTDAALDNMANVSGFFVDRNGKRIIGVYRWLANEDVVLAVEQSLSEAMWSNFLIIGLDLGVVAIAVSVATYASVRLTRDIVGRLTSLVESATQIAGGDLEQVVQVERYDEIGILAAAFNTMTKRLKNLVSGLEQRVTARTQDLQAANRALEQRALQLETSAQVSREISSILDPDNMMTRVVELITFAFGYYHVNIYLLDRQTNELVLQASSKAKEPQVQSYPVGATGLNSQAVVENRAVKVNDVSLDPRYLHDEHLPDVCSEAVTPLRVGEQVIGTLDVLCDRVGAFRDDDVLVLQSLADQIAVAIENTRLHDLNRDLAIVEERSRLARDLHDSVTQSLYSLALIAEGLRRKMDTGHYDEVKSYLGTIGQVSQQNLKEMRLLIHQLRPPVVEQIGLAGALRHRLDVVETRSGVRTSLLIDDLIDLPARVEIGLYRVAQEALNNALKHASATEVTVHIFREGGSAVLEIRDNGCGFDPHKIGTLGGMGLIGMRERIKKIGGTLDISSRQGEGTIVRVAVSVV